MASLFKKTFAAVLAIAMVVTCFTVSAADATPTLNVATTYVGAGDSSAVVNISTENFGAIYGSQFTVTFPDFVTVDLVETNDGLVWENNSNYKVDGNTLKFLDVRTNQGFDVSVNIYFAANTHGGVHDVVVSESYFIDSNEAEYDGVVINNGALSIASTVIGETGAPVIVDSEEGYFIPYGEVIVNGEYVNKESDGSFKVEGATTYTNVKLPSAEVGVTTFGTGVKEKDSFGEAGIQFGSYAVDVENKKFGTLAVKGDFADFKAYCKSKGMTDKAVYDRLVSLYNTNNKGSSVSMSYDGGKKISVLCIARKKWMWYGTIDGVMHLQYAARITNPVENETYSGVAYSYIDDVYTFSKEVKYITK